MPLPPREPYGVSLLDHPILLILRGPHGVSSGPRAKYITVVGYTAYVAIT